MTTTEQKMPAISEVATVLKGLKRNYCESGEWMDVRLQVYEDGDWAVRYGDSSYDLDHRGQWGCSSINLKSNCVEVAKELINSCE